MENNTHKAILGPNGLPASLIFNTGTIRNPGQHNEELIANNLSELGGLGSNNFTPFGLGANSQFGQVTLSQIDTMAKNLRYYFVSKFYQILSRAYVEFGLVRTIVDVPVEDGYRGGVKLKTDLLDEDDLKKLIKFMKRKRDLNVAAVSQKWGRLFGGGAVLVFMDDQDPEEPLEIEKINEKSNVEFRAVNLWELSPNGINLNQADPSGQKHDYDWFMYYGEKIHKSRVKKVIGMDVPAILRWQLMGWGASVLEPFIRPFNQYLKASDLTFEVLDEFKLDVFFVDGFKQALQTVEGEALATKRIHYANGRKNFQNATILDKLDDFQQRQLSFTGLGEVQQANLIQVASVIRMPLTKIFGISAAGFSTGQEDLENYNMMVEATIREDAEDIVTWMTEIRAQEMYGVVPDDLELEFKSLRVLGGVEEQQVKTGKAAIIQAAKGAGDISDKEYRDAINAGQLMDIKLDSSDRMIKELEKQREAMEPEEGDEEAGGEGAGKKGKSSGKTAPKPKQKGKAIGNKLSAFVRMVLNGPTQKEIVTVGIVNGTKILTGKRRDNGLWVSPGGHMDDGETIEEAAVREVFEEAGIEINIADLEKISSETLTSHRTGKKFVLHSFLARINEKNPTVDNDPDKEIEEWKWVKLDRETPELLPEARHAKDDVILKYLLN